MFAQMVVPSPEPVDVEPVPDILSDDDVQIALWALYELSYHGFDEVDPAHEWAPGLLATRATIEAPFEAALRALAMPAVERALADHGSPSQVPAALAAVVDDTEDAGLAGHLHREATEEQYREFLVHRSIYHLKESDPHAFAIPRLEGGPKVALAELQYDEFGGGRADRLHSTLFARALEGAGLDPAYGAYVDVVPAATLSVNNAMSLFALHRRLRGALMGHLAAFESTSSLPCRRYSGGAERVGFDGRVTDYFDEHVEADAVHEQLACRHICQRLVEQHPELHEDVLFGAAVCMQLEALSGTLMVDSWRSGASALLGVRREEVA